MNHWPFIIAAYAITIGGTSGIGLWCWLSMRAAERAAERLSERQDGRR